MAASAFRNLEAKRLMNFGDYEPAHIPTSNALRILKHRKYKKDLIHTDPIIGINIMMHSSAYLGSIKSLGYEPFYVMYWTSSQMKVYNLYCKLCPNPNICLDTTGSVVKRIKRPYDKKSKHIFLYDATVRDDATEKKYSVSNMLSESQDNIAINHWLALWKKDGATTPKELVCDHSIAILSAAVKTFTQFWTLEQYLKNCSKLVFQNSESTIPSCFIRCDVAHTIKLIASWDALRGKNYRTRNLYIRSLAQIVQSSDLNDIKRILESIIIVALGETEGIDIHTGEETQCEGAKSFLKERISSDTVNEKMEKLFMATVNDIYAADETEVNCTDIISDSNENMDFKMWFESIAESIKTKVFEGEGDHDNLQYLPEIIKCIANLMKRFPLWSVIMTPYFGYGNKTVSSAPVESNFKILKHQTFSENIYR